MKAIGSALLIFFTAQTLSSFESSQKTNLFEKVSEEPIALKTCFRQSGRLSERLIYCSQTGSIHYLLMDLQSGTALRFLS